MSLNSVVGNTYTSQWEAERVQSGDILIHFHDVFWGVTMEGEQANEDEGENEDGSEDEDDLIDGCHALDIGIPGIESSIWVRAEYIRIFDHIKKLYDYTTALLTRKEKIKSRPVSFLPGNLV